METISFEQLAEKLNGKLWTKGDMKRIYLDEGYNTKKMSTKTYVYERQDGSWGVSCRIECPSQNDNWITSQEDKVIEGVEKEIENIIKISTLELVEYKILEEKAEAMVYVKRNADAEPSWFTEEIFYDEFGSYPADVFGGNVEADLEVVYEKRREAVRIENEKKASEKKESTVNFDIKPAEGVLTDYEIGKTYNHSRFGNGICEAEDEKNIVINFSSEGQKKFIKNFVKLTLVNE